MLQPCQNNLFTSLRDLASKEDLVEDGVDLFNDGGKNPVSISHAA